MHLLIITSGCLHRVKWPIRVILQKKLALLVRVNKWVAQFKNKSLVPVLSENNQEGTSAERENKTNYHMYCTCGMNIAKIHKPISWRKAQKNPTLAWRTLVCELYMWCTAGNKKTTTILHNTNSFSYHTIYINLYYYAAIITNNGCCPWSMYSVEAELTVKPRQ